jgi:hypothetical protein
LVSAADSFEAFGVEVGASILKLNVPRNRRNNLETKIYCRLNSRLIVIIKYAAEVNEQQLGKKISII